MKKVHFDLREKSKSNFELNREFHDEYLKLNKEKSLSFAYRQSYRYNAKTINGYFTPETEHLRASTLNSRNMSNMSKKTNGGNILYNIFNNFSKRFKQKHRGDEETRKGILKKNLFGKEKVGRNAENKNEVFYCYV